MRSLLLFCYTLFFSTSSFADVTGAWNGWVYWNYQGSGSKCFSSLKLTETSQGLHRQGGKIECEFARMDISEQILAKVGSALSFENVEVGSWKDDSFEWTEKYSDTVYIENIISIKGNSMDYHEKWMHVSGREIYDIKGRFFRK